MKNFEDRNQRLLKIKELLQEVINDAEIIRSKFNGEILALVREDFLEVPVCPSVIAFYSLKCEDVLELLRSKAKEVRTMYEERH